MRLFLRGAAAFLATMPVLLPLWKVVAMSGTWSLPCMVAPHLTEDEAVTYWREAVASARATPACDAPNVRRGRSGMWRVEGEVTPNPPCPTCGQATP